MSFTDPLVATREIAERVRRSQMQISRLLARSLERLRGWVSDGPAA